MFYDFAIIGSGIVGISVAYNVLKKNPKAKVILLEKESNALFHQSSHNSGVVHSGLYYHPDSQKAKFCKLGLEKTFTFCKDNNIKFNQCGKLVVATNSSEVVKLHELRRNANTNGLSLKIFSKSKLKKIEPNLEGEEALFSPKTGVIDWSVFGNALLSKYLVMGGEVKYNFHVSGIDEDDKLIQIKNHDFDLIKSKKMISCGGLQSDRLARMLGIEPKLKIIPFRGDYYKLDKKFSNIFNHLIYPVPENDVPFLGIHFTKTIDNFMILGPNASVNFSRENYKRFSVDLEDIYDYLGYEGFWKLIMKYKKFVGNEFLTSFSKIYYLKQTRKYFKSLSLKDLKPFRAGIRAQAVLSDGTLAHDFIFENTKRALFVIDAPSPAATSSLPIGEFIAEKISEL